MSVVGFDIGNEKCVISAAKQRGIDVLLNDESKRETPSIVSFGDKQRFLGSAGAASAMMNYKSTITQVKRLIGRKFDDANVRGELGLLPFETSEGPDGYILIHLQYMGQRQSFTPVQILAMLFAHLKYIAEKNLGAAVSDCVIGIPSYFTDFQRRAYLNAAEIAGLKPWRLMHDCAATALSYGIYKTDFSSAGPTLVVFVDIGHCDTQVSVASFETGHMKILSHAFDESLGGRDFDEVLFDHFAQQFKDRYQIDVKSNVRACIRLRAACEKLKRVLSANAEAPIGIECLMDEKDVKGFIKREEFEQLSSSLLERIVVPCNKALIDAGLSADKIHSVELVGSGSRIPAISRTLAAVFKREPSRTLNASECVARGCALQCAMLSPIFRVRDYEVQDSYPYSIRFSSDESPIGTSPNSILFCKGQTIPTAKVLTFLSFLRSNVFELKTSYSDESELPSGVSSTISSTKILLPQAPQNYKAKIKVKVELNLHGIVTVKSASLIEDEVDDPGTRATAHSHAAKIDPEYASNATTDSRTNSADNGTNTQSEALHTATASSIEGKPINADGKRKERSRRTPLSIVGTVYGEMSNAELSDARVKECQLAYQDRVMEQTKEKRNALESFIYETRDKLFDAYRSFAAESERNEISSSLKKTEEWLYEDGDDESEMVYTEKLENLKKLVDPVENRFKDEEARTEARDDLLKHIAHYRMVGKSLNSRDRDVINDECGKVEQWLQEKLQLQESLPRSVDPVLWSNDIRRMMDELDKTCKQILDRREAKSVDHTSSDESIPAQ